MSKKPPEKSKMDRRAAKTRSSLANALIEIAPEKGIDNVHVSDLATEAKIGRSTFYAHYADRDDFIIQSFRQMFESCDVAQKKTRPEDTGILPSWHLFHHMHAVSEFAHQMSKSESYRASFPSREAIFRKVATKNLAVQFPKLPNVERDNLALLITGAFSSLMRDWAEKGLLQKPDITHEVFDSFVRRILPRN